MPLVTILVIILVFCKYSFAEEYFCDDSKNDGHYYFSNGTVYEYFYEIVLRDGYRLVWEHNTFVWTVWSWLVTYQAWILSIVASVIVGLSGIFPLLVIPIEEGANLKTGAAASTLRVLLSFAVGGLLGDVFLHLLPEAWAQAQVDGSVTIDISGAKVIRRPRPSMTPGLWVLAGILLFTVLEMMCSDAESRVNANEDEEEEEVGEETEKIPGSYNGIPWHHSGTSGTGIINSGTCLTNGTCELSNGNCKTNGTCALINRTNRPCAKVLNNCITNGTCLINNEECVNSNHDSYVLHKLHTTSLKSSLVVNNHSSYSAVTSLCNGFSSEHKVGILGHPEPADGQTKLKGHTPLINGDVTVQTRRPSKSQALGMPPVKQVAGYLNLLANSIDNFMHGLAVGGGFLVSFKMGALTTLAILIHEVPHEIGDFAILLRAGFSRWDAARAQLYTAGSGLLGALTAVACSTSSVEARTSWVVPFTAGGFLHIALVTVLPELLSERDRWESAKQVVGLLTGMVVMAVLTAFFD